MAKKPLKIDMIAGSQLRDTQGEMLSVEGADISELQAGRGRINDNHGKGFFNSIGRVTDAKKIFKVDDCENDRHKYYWEKVKAPYIYVEAELYDDEDHPNARAAAAILRNIHKTDTPLQLKASVEGGVVARGLKDSSLLARTKIHSVALTFTPANNATLVEPISLDKTQHDEEADMQLIKSVIHLAETNVPSFRHIVRDASATKIESNLEKIAELMGQLGIEDQDLSSLTKQQILQKALEDKILRNVKEINSRIKELKKKENDSLDKGLKENIAGALTSAAISLAPTATSSINDTLQNKVKQIKPAQTHEEVFRQVASQYPLLGAVGQAESSGGKNLDHAVVTSGIHKGHKAGGPWGMMPLAASFIINKDKNLAAKHPELVEASKDIKNKHHVFTETFNKDPQAAADFAIAMFNRNKAKTKSDHQLIYSWLNGLKGSWNKLKSDGHDSIKAHPYVQKVMKEYNKQASKKDQQNQVLNVGMNKALMAGYSGASAPSSRMGGAVIQVESLESPKTGFKYICCNNCGKEQVHSKFQVKCRECGHGFSFEKLYDVVRGNK